MNKRYVEFAVWAAIIIAVTLLGRWANAVLMPMDLLSPEKIPDKDFTRCRKHGYKTGLGDYSSWLSRLAGT